MQMGKNNTVVYGGSLAINVYFFITVTIIITIIIIIWVVVE